MWFQLRDGRFEQVPGPGGFVPTGMRPWTVQERIAEMVELSGRPYLAVNGYGVAGVNPGPSGYPLFRPFYDPLLFRHRTLTRMLPRDGSLLCHVYFNSLLNETTTDALELPGISLLELFPGDGVYRHRTPPFQRGNPEWQCVGFAPVAPVGPGEAWLGEALLAWKRSAPRETRFAYTRVDLQTGTETAARQEEYRQALGFRPLDQGAEPALRALARAAAQRSERPGRSTGLQLRLKASGEDPEERYQLLPPDFQAAERISLLTLPVQERAGRFTLLCPDGTLLRAAAGSERVEDGQLPALPEGFVYTELLLSGEFLLAAWEQQEFTGVGAAGLVVRDAPEDSGRSP
ncbi:MAG: hypothetical protein JW820_16995 [Spirochaetales bacterium]|nr:hypothetical protein [Spirochaetales bacterium]